MKRFGLSSLKFKVLMLSVVPAALLSLLIGGYLTTARLADLENALQSRGQALADEIAAIAVYGLFSGDTSTLKLSARSFFSQPDIVSISIKGNDGTELIHISRSSNNDHPDTLQPYKLYRFESAVTGIPTEEPLEPDDYLDTRADVPLETLGLVELQLADRSLIGIQREILLTAILMILVGILLTGLLALVIGRRVIRPIIGLSDAVSRIRQGDLDTRVDNTSKGELGILEEGFNAMAARVAMTQDELMAEVDQAVEDLQTTMDALEVRNIELDLARKKALKANRVKSDFLAMISHEIRTPMNGIIGFARLLHNSRLDQQQAEQLGAIQDSAENLLAIINDVLDFSKLESGHITFHNDPFRMRQLVEGVITLLKPQAMEKGLALNSMVYDDVPDELVGDRLRIRQVLINLLGNAIKFTQEGQITLRVMLDGEDEEELVTFQVQDTGIGLPADARNKLFQPFSQIDTSSGRQYGGTGLGLSICRKLVEGMRGSIGFESTHGMGSTFWFTLPLPIAGSPRLPSAMALPQRPGHKETTSPFRDIRILVADDNHINLKLAETLLTNLGVRVTVAETGQDALAQADSEPFDLILMDMHMPMMNGIEASRGIRNGNGPNVATPIVAITADVTIESEQLAFKAGMSQILLKPIDEDKLIQTIQAALQPPQSRPQSSSGSIADPNRPGQKESTLPLRDRESALSAVAGNTELAEEMFEMLLNSLDSDLEVFAKLTRTRQWEALWERIHKLLGAASACGVPALHGTLREMEQSVKQRRTQDLHRQLRQLNRITERLQELNRSASDTPSKN